MPDHARAHPRARRFRLGWRLGLIMLLLCTDATPALADLPPGAVWVANKTINLVSTYPIAADGRLGAVSEEDAGTDPTTLTVHPSGMLLYGLNNASRPLPDLSVYAIDAASHALTGLGRVPACNDPTWVGVHPHGRTLYFTCHGFAAALPNVALNALGWAMIDAVTGMPTVVDTVYAWGTQPTEGVVHASGRYLVLATYLSDLLAVFHLDPDTGAPTFVASVPTGERADVVDGPRSLAFDASGATLPTPPSSM